MPLMESLECYANGRPSVGRTVRPGPPLGPRDCGGYESAPVGRLGWAIGRVSPGVRTATRPYRPPRSPDPRRHGGSSTQRPSHGRGAEVQRERYFVLLPNVSSKASKGKAGATAPPPFQKEYMYNLEETRRDGSDQKHVII